ncbi:MAG: class I SAM-dependent methyltransferase [Verrucomicrobiota bacterium]
MSQKPATLGQFIRDHDYPCWCGVSAGTVFCSQTFGRRPFAALRCPSCGTQRLLPRVLDSQEDASELYNNYDPPRPTEEELQDLARHCLERLARTGIEFKKGDRVLDVGCGNGRILEAICSRFECIGHGVDADERRVSDAKASAKHATFETGLFDPTAYPQPFDIVISSAVIEHVYDPVDFIRQLARVVKPGGSLFLLTPNAASLNYRILRSWWRELLSLGEHIYLFTPESLGRCGERSGLTVAGTASDFDFATPSLNFGGIRPLLLSGWSLYREACKRVCAVFAGSRRGDILCVHFRKPA